MKNGRFLHWILFENEIRLLFFFGDSQNHFLVDRSVWRQHLDRGQCIHVVSPMLETGHSLSYRRQFICIDGNSFALNAIHVVFTLGEYLSPRIDNHCMTIALSFLVVKANLRRCNYVALIFDGTCT